MEVHFFSVQIRSFFRFRSDPRSLLLFALENGGQGKSCYFGDFMACISLPTILRRALFATESVPHFDTCKACHWL